MATLEDTGVMILSPCVIVDREQKAFSKSSFLIYIIPKLIKNANDLLCNMLILIFINSKDFSFNIFQSLYLKQRTSIIESRRPFHHIRDWHIFFLCLIKSHIPQVQDRGNNLPTIGEIFLRELTHLHSCTASEPLFVIYQVWLTDGHRITLRDWEPHRVGFYGNNTIV